MLLTAVNHGLTAVNRSQTFGTRYWKHKSKPASDDWYSTTKSHVFRKYQVLVCLVGEISMIAKNAINNLRDEENVRNNLQALLDSEGRILMIAKNAVILKEKVIYIYIYKQTYG